MNSFSVLAQLPGDSLFTNLTVWAWRRGHTVSVGLQPDLRDPVIGAAGTRKGLSLHSDGSCRVRTISPPRSGWSKGAGAAPQKLTHQPLSTQPQQVLFSESSARNLFFLKKKEIHVALGQSLLREWRKQRIHQLSRNTMSCPSFHTVHIHPLGRWAVGREGLSFLGLWFAAEYPLVSFAFFISGEEKNNFLFLFF